MELKPPESSHTSSSYSVIELPDIPDIRIGKSRDLKPAILINLSLQSELSTPVPPIRLRHIEIYSNSLCRIHLQNGATSEERLALVVCRSDDIQLQSYFLTVLPMIFATHFEAQANDNINSALSSVAELFKLIEEPPHKSVQAIWSELLLIERSSDPSRMLSAWRNGVHDKYDFSDGMNRLEVKSSSRGVRIHTFSLDQLMAPPDVTVVIASLLVRELAGGSSIRNLVNGIRKKCSDPTLLLKLETVITRTLGASTPQAIEVTFDLPFALDELRYYNATIIPAVNPPIPGGVSNVRFDSDLAFCSVLVPSALSNDENCLTSLLTKPNNII
ncbi:MAG: PD-(D/E)XK motif protein [Planctomycetales bacterium]|nr:MAG: PD-(D/E)XK motif protein [Planctomycetales bacterium]